MLHCVSDWVCLLLSSSYQRLFNSKPRERWEWTRTWQMNSELKVTKKAPWSWGELQIQLIIPHQRRRHTVASYTVIIRMYSTAGLCSITCIFECFQEPHPLNTIIDLALWRDQLSTDTQSVSSVKNKFISNEAGSRMKGGLQSGGGRKRCGVPPLKSQFTWLHTLDPNVSNHYSKWRFNVSSRFNAAKVLNSLHLCWSDLLSHHQKLPFSKWGC